VLRYQVQGRIPVQQLLQVLLRGEVGSLIKLLHVMCCCVFVCTFLVSCRPAGAGTGAVVSQSTSVQFALIEDWMQKHPSESPESKIFTILTNRKAIVDYSFSKLNGAMSPGGPAAYSILFVERTGVCSYDINEQLTSRYASNKYGRRDYLSLLSRARTDESRQQFVRLSDSNKHLSEVCRKFSENDLGGLVELALTGKLSSLKKAAIRESGLSPEIRKVFL
jgi:hypothetical protein